MPITGSYNTVPRILKQNQSITFTTSPGGPPEHVDAGPTSIDNMRGNVTYRITASDSGHVAMFEMIGGFGEFTNQHTQSWEFIPGSEFQCTVNQTAVNAFTVTTTDGGRVYDFIFTKFSTIAPTVERTAGATTGIGDSITFKVTSPVVIGRL